MELIFRRIMTITNNPIEPQGGPVILDQLYQELTTQKSDAIDEKVYREAAHFFSSSGNEHTVDFCGKLSQAHEKIDVTKKTLLINAISKEFLGTSASKMNKQNIIQLLHALDNEALLDTDRCLLKQMLARLENRSLDEVFTTVKALNQTTPSIVKEKLGLKAGDLVFMSYKQTPGALANTPPKSAEESVQSSGHTAMWVEGDKNLAHITFAKGTYNTGGATLTALPMSDTYSIFRCKRQDLTERVAEIGFNYCSKKTVVEKDKILETYPDHLPLKVVKKKIEKVENELKSFSTHNKKSLDEKPLFDRIYGSAKTTEINGEPHLAVWDQVSASWMAKQDSTKPVEKRETSYEMRQTKYNHLLGKLTKQIFVDDHDLDVPDQFKSEDIRRALKFAQRSEDSSMTSKSGVRCSEFVIALFHAAAFEKQAKANAVDFAEKLGAMSEQEMKEYLPSSMTLGSKLIRTNYLSQKVSMDDEFEYVGYFDILNDGVVVGYPSGDVEFIQNK